MYEDMEVGFVQYIEWREAGDEMIATEVREHYLFTDNVETLEFGSISKKRYFELTLKGEANRALIKMYTKFYMREKG